MTAATIIKQEPTHPLLFSHMSKETYIHMSKETYIHMSKETHIQTSTETNTRVKRDLLHIYIYIYTHTLLILLSLSLTSSLSHTPTLPLPHTDSLFLFLTQASTVLYQQPTKINPELTHTISLFPPLSPTPSLSHTHTLSLRHKHALLFLSSLTHRYGVATVSRLLKNIGLFCRISCL